MRAFTLAAAAALIAICLAPAPSTTATNKHQHHRHPCRAGVAVETCAHRLVWHRWPSNKRAEWQALDAVISHESGWDPCAHWPGVHHDCGYNGAVLCTNGLCSNACGIPQATPCPTGWRGHLERFRRQIRWLIRYVAQRYGDPIGALAHYNDTGWY